MNRIALFVHTTPVIDDTNFPRIAGALMALGVSVDVLLIDSLSLRAGHVVAEGYSWQDNYSIGQPTPPSQFMTIDHGLIWVLSLGNRFGFLDKYQLLHLLEPTNRIINSLDAIMHLNSKYLPAAESVFNSPATYASTRSQELIDIVKTNPGYWIVKPPAGSLGRDVFKVDGQDSNLEAIVANLCGPNDSQYTLLQRYVSEIENGEKRVLIAGGRVIAQYLRTQNGDHRTNVTQGATTSICELSPPEQQFCDGLARTLLKRGVLFAGIDLAYPWMIEVNVINPGGLGTIAQLTGQDRSDEVCRAILACLDLEF